MAEIFVGEVAVGVVPDARNFNDEMRKQLFPEADNVGREYGAKLGRGIQESIRISIEKVKADLEKEGFKANVDADTTKAKDQIDTMRAEQEARPVKVKVETDQNSLRRFGSNLASQLRQSLGRIALGSLIGGGLFGGGSALLAGIGPLGAATLGIGAAAAFIVPEITKATAALGKFGAARKTAFARLTPQEREMARSLEGIKKSFQDLQKELAPAVDKLIQLGAGFIKSILPELLSFASVGISVIQNFLMPFSAWVKTKAFEQLSDQFAQFGDAAGAIVGPQLVQLMKAFSQLFLQLLPTGLQLLKVLIPLITILIIALTPGIVIMAKLAVAALTWLTANHLLIPAIFAISAAIVILMGATGLGGIIAATIAVGLATGFLATHWKQIWQDIKNWAQDAWNFLTHGWGQFLFPGLKLIIITVDFVSAHWRAAWNGMKSAATTLWKFVGPLFKIGFDIIVGLFLLLAKIAGVVWKALVLDAKIWWAVTKPILDVFGKVAVFVFKNIILPAAKFLWDHFLSQISSAIEGGKRLFRVFLTVLLNIFGAIIHGAAQAFGWVPGLGGKLKDAAHQFDIFKSRVNAALGGINGRTVNVGVAFAAARSGRGQGPALAKPLARGGPIYGEGTATSDSNLALLSHGEWVIKQASAAKYGNKAMAAINEGRAWIGYANGGLVGYATGGGVNVKTVLPSSSAIADALIPVVIAMAKTFGNQLAAAAAAAGGSGGPASGAVRALQQYAASLFHFYGWGGNQLPPLIALWNGESGWNPRARNPSSGAFGIPQALPPGKMGALAASGNAAAQIRWGEGYIHQVYGTPANAYGSWLRRSPHWYDEGGWMYPGEIGMSKATKPEPVLTSGQWDAIYSAASKGGSGSTEYHAHFDGMTRQVLRAEVRQSFQEMEIGKGKLARMGRRN